MAKSEPTHNDMANAIRALSMDAVQKANSGHPGMPMGMADVATVLFRDVLKFDPKFPEWPDRDRFVLSAGHGSMLLYSLLHLTGYEDMTIEQIKNFRQWGAKTAGHPEYGHAQGIETTTGPLGQGLANAVGMAMAERITNGEFGDELVDHHTYCIVGDGCLMEGISQEAISLAGHLRLNKLIVLFDDNAITIDGPTSLCTSEDHIGRVKACGWDAVVIDGHDPAAITQAIHNAKVSDKPSFIACKTTIAKGAPTKAGTSGSHGAPLGDEEIAGAREKLGWPHAPFEIPENILNAWREAGTRSADAFAAWSKRLDDASEFVQNAFLQSANKALPVGWQEGIDEMKRKLSQDNPKEATRKSSGNVLSVLSDAIPNLIGGSADLTGSNLTKVAGMDELNPKKYNGQYIYYGIREHAMAAAMNGMALHGGVIPYGGTFMVFTDYCRPAIRLSALMQQRVIYVMTHDSIGLGEDGPTHQPVEHMAALRAIPNLHVFRPCDSTETAECWALAIATADTPSILALTRQGVPHLRREYVQENKCAYGGYILSESEGEPEVVLMATGSEVHLCIEAQVQLKANNIAARVVSMPSWELFEKQPAQYRDTVLGGNRVLRVAVEAATGMGWERYIGQEGIFIGMDGFGASAPAETLYEKFGITTEAIVGSVLDRLR